MENNFLNQYDYACAAESAQAFEGLMPKVNLDKCGSAQETLAFYEEGRGVEALEVVDVKKIAE